MISTKSLVIILLCITLLIPAIVLADGMPPDDAPVRRIQTEKAKDKKATSKVKKEAPAPIQVGETGNTKPLSDFELAKYQYCGNDRDCTVAINGCCDCANGGIEVGVNRDRLEALKKRFDCLYQECGSKPADPPCANGVLSCVNHRCKYFDDTKR